MSSVSSAMRFRFSVNVSKPRKSIVFSLSLVESLVQHREEIQPACRNALKAANAVFRLQTGFIGPRSQSRPGGAWRQCNTRRGVLSTWAVLAALLATLPAAPPAWGATAEPMPDPADVVGAYLTLRDWIDRFQLPAPDDPASEIRLRQARGVCVILRNAGRVVGAGTDATGDDLMARRAAGRAMGEVLGDPAAADLPDEMTDRMGRRLTLELEVAGGLIPLLGRTYQDVAAQLEPGLDGVAMRRGEEVAMLFPAQMRARNTAGHAERVLLPLAADLGMSPAPLPELIDRFDLSIYRFRSTDLAQLSPDGAPLFTFRGDRVVGDVEVTRRALAALADGIARHLVEHMSPLEEPVGLMGTYRPLVDRYEPLIAPPLDQALAAWALARYAQLPGGAETDAAAALAGAIIDELAQVTPGEDDPLANAVACAAIVIAADALGQLGLEAPPARDRFIEEAVQRVLSAYAPGRGFADTDPGDGRARPVAPHGQAMIAAAMTRLLAGGDPQVTPDQARSALDAAWAAVPPHRQVTLLPWLGWAESDFSAATGTANAGAEQLTALRDYLDVSRVGSSQRAGPPDLAGGFALADGTRLLVTAQTLRPAAYLATMALDPQLTPPDQMEAAMGRHLQTMRFVLQLTVRDTAAWTMRRPARALGGVRGAVWDADQPVAAQAMGLVTACETLAGLDELANR